MYDFCSKCGGFRANPEKCQCKPFIISDDCGEEHERYALDHEGAALSFAEQYNEEGDYSLMNNTMNISVRNQNGKELEFQIAAEPDIRYSATEID